MPQFWLIIFLSVAEMLILLIVLFFFMRLKRSEALLERLQSNQEAFIERLQHNAELEQELVASFAQRQAELRSLDIKIGERSAELRRLLEQAEGIQRSPQFLREIILNNRRKGHSVSHIAQSAGITVDEVELILAQSGEK